jgi:hypothetical protein
MTKEINNVPDEPSIQVCFFYLFGKSDAAAVTWRRKLFYAILIMIFFVAGKLNYEPEGLRERIIKALGRQRSKD